MCRVVVGVLVIEGGGGGGGDGLGGSFGDMGMTLGGVGIGTEGFGWMFGLRRSW